MRQHTLLERVLYKYEYIGQVEKDGRIEKKYRKVRRFPFLKKLGPILVYIGAAIIMLWVYNLVFEGMQTTKVERTLKKNQPAGSF